MLDNEPEDDAISAQPLMGISAIQESVILRNGGADRDRTDDPLLAKQMLSQLSYSPGSSEDCQTLNVQS
jgi:hypothetical protein